MTWALDDTQGMTEAQVGVFYDKLDALEHGHDYDEVVIITADDISTNPIFSTLLEEAKLEESIGIDFSKDVDTYEGSTITDTLKVLALTPEGAEIVEALKSEALKSDMDVDELVEGFDDLATGLRDIYDGDNPKVIAMIERADYNSQAFEGKLTESFSGVSEEQPIDYRATVTEHTPHDDKKLGPDAQADILNLATDEFDIDYKAYIETGDIEALQDAYDIGHQMLTAPNMPRDKEAGSIVNTYNNHVNKIIGNDVVLDNGAIMLATDEMVNYAPLPEERANNTVTQSLTSGL